MSNPEDPYNENDLDEIKKNSLYPFRLSREQWRAATFGSVTISVPELQGDADRDYSWINAVCGPSASDVALSIRDKQKFVMQVDSEGRSPTVILDCADFEIHFFSATSVEGLLSVSSGIEVVNKASGIKDLVVPATFVRSDLAVKTKRYGKVVIEIPNSNWVLYQAWSKDDVRELASQMKSSDDHWELLASVEPPLLLGSKAEPESMYGILLTPLFLRVVSCGRDSRLQLPREAQNCDAAVDNFCKFNIDDPQCCVYKYQALYNQNGSHIPRAHCYDQRCRGYIHSRFPACELSQNDCREIKKNKELYSRLSGSEPFRSFCERELPKPVPSVDSASKAAWSVAAVVLIIVVCFLIAVMVSGPPVPKNKKLIATT